jgi:drug/metabolite transporter (DMT)-like permease
MAWFWLALLAQFLFSVGVHIDKHLLSRYLKGSSPGSLILFSSLFGFVVMPIAYAVDRRVLEMSPRDIGLLVGCGLLNITAIVLYLYALARDEASVVAPLFQLIPVFSYVLAYAILGETVSTEQMAGAALIIVGAVLITIDLRARRLKATIFVLMTIASLLLALNGVVFKEVAMEGGFWVSTFWSYASLALAGILLFSFVRPYRDQFLRTLRSNRAPVLVLNTGNEVLAVVGYMLITYATLLAPVALVSVVGGLQPLMVFLLGWLLSVAIPSIGRERLTRAEVVQKLLAIAIVFAGTFLLQRG